MCGGCCHQQRAASIVLINESQALFHSKKSAEAYKVLEKLRDTGASTYLGYFAWKSLSEKK